MEPWFIEAQAKARTAELTEKWADAAPVPGTWSFSLTHNLPISSPEVPWLEPIAGYEGQSSEYYLTVSGGGSDMPKGSGHQFLVLGMRAFTPGSAEPTECQGYAFVGQVAECGGWVIRVEEAHEGDGAFRLLAYPDVPGYRLMQGENDPVPGH